MQFPKIHEVTVVAEDEFRLFDTFTDDLYVQHVPNFSVLCTVWKQKNMFGVVGSELRDFCPL